MQEERYWQAVVSRERDPEARFVYAVKSTGIYCRPGCPSRRPRREQVLFFEVPQAAEEAGFRPCLRCRPRGQAGASPEQVELIDKAREYIEANTETTIKLEDLAEQVGLSPYHLHRTFKRIVGVTPRQYAEALRLRRFKDGLKAGSSVTGAIYEAGYGSGSRLYEQASARLGMTPTAYRKGGKEMNITYTIVDSPAGRVLVAATERGLCSVSIGDTDEQLVGELRHEYPLAEMWEDRAAMADYAGSVLGLLEGRQPQHDLPLDVQATAFQWQVWEALRTIPYGSTRSYGEVAAALGDPHKARAVGRACATNKVALVIPCHRVVAHGGKIGEYRWGQEHKRLILEQEQRGLHHDEGANVADAEHEVVTV